MQKQSKLMASAENLVNLDMKEGVKSMNIEQVCHAISRKCRERIHSPHTAIRPDLSCRKTPGRVPSSSRPRVGRRGVYTPFIHIRDTALIFKFTKLTAPALAFRCVRMTLGIVTRIAHMILYGSNPLSHGHGTRANSFLTEGLSTA